MEVLNKVKELLLLPELDVATSQQVADFYEVDYEAIKKIIQRHTDELTEDGYRTIGGKQIKDILVRDSESRTKIKPMKGHFMIDGYKISYRNMALFPKRAILRVGMLLRDSAVAKEVRTQLLNIEENTATEIKTYEIDHETELHTKLGNFIVNSLSDKMKLREIRERLVSALKAPSKM
ncbi:hypothetical protein bthur0010_22490 [Bacillus thuringiensis serovar pondicheriensis BGSC 4BA1]|nr:hypothetical protein bthur0010_22490 [Bacillus thuringiensis serovar pondicheriensis BGSC 4BA1]